MPEALKLQSQEQLAATLYEPDTEVVGKVLFVHGWGSDQLSPSVCAEALSSKGYRCLTFDLSGHGASTGDKDLLSRAQFLSDVLVAYDFLQDGSGTAPFVVGASFGAYLSCCLSAKRPLSGIALRVPANYPDIGFDDILVETKNNKEIMAEYRKKLEAGPLLGTKANKALSAFAGPVLIVESGADEVIHPNTVLGYNHSVQPGRLSFQVMEDAPHSIGRTPHFREQYRDLLVEWFEKVARA